VLKLKGEKEVQYQNEEYYHVYLYGFMTIALFLNIVLHTLYPLLPKESHSSYDEIGGLSGATFVIYYFFFLVFVLIVGGAVYWVVNMSIKKWNVGNPFLHFILYFLMGSFSGFLIPIFPTTGMIFSSDNINTTFNPYYIFGVLLGGGLFVLNRIVDKRKINTT